jgi:chlorobactene glucosyltransferase
VRAVRQFRAYRKTALGDAGGAPAATVAIIVPVRNEIDNIDECLDGLVAQSCLPDRRAIIVVDDQSSDGTVEAVERRVARGDPVRLIGAGPLPAGWVGKPHACWQGALAAEGKWLCFIDADVRAAPGLVASALAAAEADRVDMLSLRPFQELGSFWERVVMPAGLLILACVKDRDSAVHADRSAAAANGQFILIRREVYFAIGGHAAVAGEISEDRALAIRARQMGWRFLVLAADTLARTRMYRDFASLWEGLSKNVIDIIGSAPATLLAALAGFMVGWAALLAPLAIGAAAWWQPSAAAAVGTALALAGSAAVIAIQIGTARHFRIPALYGLLFACGYTLAVGLATHGILQRLGGRTRWKGRTYGPDRNPSPGRT